MNDTVLRIHREKNFKTISCTAIDDRRLSWRAKGIHTYLVTRPDKWKFYSGIIVSLSSEGKDSVRSALKELKSAGYLRIIRANGKHGELTWKWDIAEIPTYTMSASAIDGSAIDGSAIDGKPAPINKKYRNSKDDNIENKSSGTAASSTPSVSDTPRSKKRIPLEQQEWIQIYLPIWKAKFGDTAHFTAKSANALGKLDREHGPELVAPQLKAYLAQTEAMFVNLWRFYEAFGSWARSTDSRVDPALLPSDKPVTVRTFN